MLSGCRSSSTAAIPTTKWNSAYPTPSNRPPPRPHLHLAVCSAKPSRHPPLRTAGHLPTSTTPFPTWMCPAISTAANLPPPHRCWPGVRTNTPHGLCNPFAMTGVNMQSPSGERSPWPMLRLSAACRTVGALGAWLGGGRWEQRRCLPLCRL